MQVIRFLNHQTFLGTPGINVIDQTNDKSVKQHISNHLNHRTYRQLRNNDIALYHTKQFIQHKKINSQTKKEFERTDKKRQCKKKYMDTEIDTSLFS